MSMFPLSELRISTGPLQTRIIYNWSVRGESSVFEHRSAPSQLRRFQRDNR